MNDASRKKAELLYRRYVGLMYYIARKYTKSDEMVEDAVHETFSRLLPHLDQIGDPESKETRNFIGIVTRNTTLNFLKHQHLDRQISLLDENARPIEVAVEFNFENIFADDFIRNIQKCLQALKKEYSDILLLKIKYSFSNKELAILLGINENNVKARLSRARTALRKELEKQGRLKEFSE